MATSVPPQKVSLSSINDLKTTSDDALSPYLTTLPKPYTFTQQHYLANVRLILGYTAVTIAGLLFYVDWKQGWDITKPYTLPACVAYFVLNGALTYWIWAVEAGTVFKGVREGGQRLTLKSSIKKHDPTYRLCVLYSAPKTATKWEDKQIEGKFTEWFNMHGYLDKKAFRKWLARNIEVVGMADPVSVQAGEKKMDEIIDESVIAAVNVNASGADVGLSTPAGKRGRPKKKP